MSVPTRRKPKYTCDNCGSHNYTLTMTNPITPWFDGPHGPPTAYYFKGCQVRVICNNCGEALTPLSEDMDRLFSCKKGMQFEHREPVSTDI